MTEQLKNDYLDQAFLISDFRGMSSYLVKLESIFEKSILVFIV